MTILTKLKIIWIFLKASFAFIITTGKAIYKMGRVMRDSWKFVKHTKEYQKEQKAEDDETRGADE